MLLVKVVHDGIYYLLVSMMTISFALAFATRCSRQINSAGHEQQCSYQYGSCDYSNYIIILFILEKRI